MAGLCHCVLCKDTDQFSTACLLAYDGLHDELPKGSALNAVNTEGYRNDEFKAIHIIADNDTNLAAIGIEGLDMATTTVSVCVSVLAEV